MATGAEWREYFEKKSTPYLGQQLKEIRHVLEKLDSKVISEFQLTWLDSVRLVIVSVLRKRGIK